VPLISAPSAVASATPSSVVLKIAKYAAATAAASHPPGVVTAVDVSNALDALPNFADNIQLGFNLGEVIGYARWALFVDHSTFTQICVDFPNFAGGVPRVMHCPRRALAEWQYWPGVLRVSEQAIVAAAANSRAVSASDVVAIQKPEYLTMTTKPSFEAGRGGTVKFAVVTNIGGASNFTEDICVQFPKTAYGIPIQVAC